MGSIQIDEISTGKILFQNGFEDRVVTERYLNDLFGRVDV